jgi:hypothetical protein
MGQPTSKHEKHSRKFEKFLEPSSDMQSACTQNRSIMFLDCAGTREGAHLDHTHTSIGDRFESAYPPAFAPAASNRVRAKFRPGKFLGRNSPNPEVAECLAP